MKLRLVAASLVAALAASPVILDACLFTCHGSIATDEDRSEPSCHQVTEDADLRFEPPATACGHDHSQSASMTATDRGADARVDMALSPRDAYVLENVAQREAQIAHRFVRDTGLGRTDSPPLRV